MAVAARLAAHQVGDAINPELNLGVYAGPGNLTSQVLVLLPAFELQPVRMKKRAQRLALAEGVEQLAKRRVIRRVCP